MSNATLALVGEFSPDITAHRGIVESLKLCRDQLGLPIDSHWVRTDSIEVDDECALERFDGFWCVPGSPYARTDGALAAIQWARTRGIPFLGTCGGFQHALLEFARHVLGLADAAHEELDPGASSAVVSHLSCSLVEKSQTIRATGTGRFQEWFGAAERTEEFHCRFGLNPKYEQLFQSSALRIAARSSDGEVRAVELAGHPFFVGTLFQPERSALRVELHPIVRAFATAVASSK